MYKFVIHWGLGEVENNSFFHKKQRLNTERKVFFKVENMWTEFMPTTDSCDASGQNTVVSLLKNLYLVLSSG